jgi:hypothetical protein
MSISGNLALSEKVNYAALFPKRINGVRKSNMLRTVVESLRHSQEVLGLSKKGF